MEIKVKYSDLKDRDVKAKEQEAKGLQMLHDTFDANWKRGDEPHGTMIFTDDVPIASVLPDYKTLWKNARTVDEKMSIIGKLLNIEQVCEE